MITNISQMQPVVGMTLTFKATADASLAGVPATVVDVWPRFRSGDFLVTLEFAQPVKVGKEMVRHIDAFMSELDELVQPELVQEVNGMTSVSFLRAA